MIKITITGIDHYMNVYDLDIHQKVILKKEPDNKFDTEAIAVYTDDFEKIGYVANSTNTVAKGTYSSGRLYDKMKDQNEAIIDVIIHKSAIAIVNIEE